MNVTRPEPPVRLRLLPRDRAAEHLPHIVARGGWVMTGVAVVDAAVPRLAPSGDGDQALRMSRFRHAAREAAGLLFRDRHEFLAGGRAAL